MKVNIQKFQTGGGFKTFTPIIHSTPTRSAKSDTSTTQKNSPSSMLDEKTYELLMTKGGLSNDVNELVEQIISLEAVNPNMGFAYGQPTNSAMALRISAKVRELMNTKENWINAGNAAKESGGLNEIAVDGYNQMYTKSENGALQTITISDYLKKGKPLRLLTVAEVLNERNSNPNLVGRDDLLDVANNAIGVEKILGQVKDLISAIGKESVSETDVYSQKELSSMLASLTDSKRKPTPDELKSLSKLQSALNTKSAYYEIKSSEDSEKKYLDKAFNYIWGTLDRGKQQKLAAVAAVNGESNPKLFIWDMLNNSTDHARTLEVTPMAKLTGDTTTSDRPRTTFELQNNGQTGQEIVRWNDPITGLVMNLAGNNVSLWDNAGNNTMVKMGPLANLLESHTGALLKRTDVFFGDKRVGVGDYDNIIVDPNAGSARVYFPVKSDGSPDYDLMTTINDIRATAPKNLTPEQLTAYFAEKGYSFVQFDKNFILKPNRDIKPFLLTYGYADEKSSSIDDNKQIRELSGIQEKETEDMMTRLHTKMKIKEPTGFFNWSNSYYKGNILIPYLDDSSIIAASLVGNIIAPKTYLEDAKIHQNVEKARILNASSSIFNTK